MVAERGDHRQRCADAARVSHHPLRLRWSRSAVSNGGAQVRQRDLGVTGPRRWGAACCWGSTDRMAMAGRTRVDSAPDGSDARWRAAYQTRSEERRVGKESGYRWARALSKTKRVG